MGWVQYIMDKMQMNYRDEYDDELEEYGHDESFAFLNHFKNMGASQMKEVEVMRIVLIRTETIEDSKEICDQLLMGNAVVINMETASEDQKSRIIDFISGAIYGLNGSILPVSKVIYAVVPEDVELVEEG